MSEQSPVRRTFTKAAEMTMLEATTNMRVDAAVTRMNKHFEKCEPALAQSRYRDLLTKHGAAPALRPSYAQGATPDHMWKAAKQMVRYEHLHRLNRIRRVGEQIIGRRRDGLER